MFGRNSLIIAFVLFVALLGVLLSRTDDAESEYAQLIEGTSNAKKKGTTTVSFSQAARSDVTKEIWFQKKEPLHLKICSKKSELFFFHSGTSIEAVEELEEASCLIQEELFYRFPNGKESVERGDHGVPMQRLHYLEAKKACYNYTTNLFIGEEVLLWKFETEGHQLPNDVATLNALMKGEAEVAEFALNGAQIDFNFKQLKTTFDSQLGQDNPTTYLEAENAHYDGLKIKLTENVFVKNCMGELSAQKATLTQDHEKRGKIDFPWLDLKEKVRVVLPKGGELLCDRVYTDYFLKRSTLSGDIFYKDARVELKAKSAEIDYEEKEGRLIPKKVTLYEDVELIEGQKVALADLVEYFPEEKLLLLKSTSTGVLFYDREKKMELVAPKIKAQREGEVDKIEGQGQVRLVLRDEEMKRLKERFKWKEPS